MSTKIRNGYLIRNAHDLIGLMSILRGFGESARTIAEELFASLQSKLAVEAIDATALGIPLPWRRIESQRMPTKVVPVSAARDHIWARQRQIKATNSRDPEVDFQCEVCVVPHKKKVYALLYTEQKAIQSLWESIPGVTPYPYWDCTDGPKNITVKAWDRRGKEWDTALNDGAPVRVGVTYDAVDSRMIWPSAEMIVAKIPTFKDRVRSWANDIARDEWVGGQSKDGDDFHDVLDRIYEFDKFKKTDDGKSYIAAREAIIRPKMKPVLEEADLVRLITPIHPEKPEKKPDA